MSSERVDAVGYLAELTIDGRVFFYAMVSIDGSDDDVELALTHPTWHPLCPALDA